MPDSGISSHEMPQKEEVPARAFIFTSHFSYDEMFAALTEVLRNFDSTEISEDLAGAGARRGGLGKCVKFVCDDSGEELVVMHCRHGKNRHEARIDPGFSWNDERKSLERLRGALVRAVHATEIHDGAANGKTAKRPPGAE